MAEPHAQTHGLLAAAAVAIVIAGVATYRSLGAGPAGVRQALAAPVKPIPTVDLQPWLPYAAPSSDTADTADAAAVVRLAGAPAVVAAHDPFAAPQIVAVAAAPRPADDDAESKAAADTEPAWIVTATLIAGSRRAAVINDKLVYLGDSLPGGGRLTAVEHDRVVVTDPRGASHALPVKEGDH